MPDVVITPEMMAFLENRTYKPKVRNKPSNAYAQHLDVSGALKAVRSKVGTTRATVVVKPAPKSAGFEDIEAMFLKEIA